MKYITKSEISNAINEALLEMSSNSDIDIEKVKEDGLIYSNKKDILNAISIIRRACPKYMEFLYDWLTVKNPTTGQEIIVKDNIEGYLSNKYEKMYRKGNIERANKMLEDILKVKGWSLKSGTNHLDDIDKENRKIAKKFGNNPDSQLTPFIKNPIK